MSIITQDGIKMLQEKTHIYCDSRELAKQFGKEHKDVLRKIEKEIEIFGGSELRHQINTLFIESDYGNRGKRYPRYKLTFEGFQQIALSFTGKKATMNRYKFIKVFMELLRNVERDKLAAIAQSNDAYWLQVREEGKEVRKELTQVIKDTVVHYRMEVEGKMNDGRYYQHFTRIIYESMGITLPKGANPRDVLNNKQVVELEMLEKRVIKLIEKYHGQGVHYKEYFHIIKEKLLEG